MISNLMKKKMNLDLLLARRGEKRRRGLAAAVMATCVDKKVKRAGKESKIEIRIKDMDMERQHAQQKTQGGEDGKAKMVTIATGGLRRI